LFYNFNHNNVTDIDFIFDRICRVYQNWKKLLKSNLV